MKIKFRNKILFIVLLNIILSFLLINFYSNKLSPLLLKLGVIEGKKKGIEIISKGIYDDISSYLDTKELFIVEKDNNGNIEMIDYNTKVVNNIISIASKKVINNYNDFQNKNSGIIKRVPIGVVTNNIFFSNLGPRVPVRIKLDGNALTSIKTKVKEYGINSALIDVYIRIEVNLDIIIPFYSKKISVYNDIPVSMKVIKGNVSSILGSE
ncbi:MAG: sporulation protein YunB [Bacilli bacterium]|nr:sporulation protein YunB [Bacilli bacterium]